jgi:hypothetical protein
VFSCTVEREGVGLYRALLCMSHTISYQSIPLPILCCPSHTITILMSPLPHEQLPINFITNTMHSNSQYNLPYVSPNTRSVTNEFNYQYYAVHLTLYTSLCHPSSTISYQSTPLLILCCKYSYMFRVYKCSLHQAGYGNWNRK